MSTASLPAPIQQVLDAICPPAPQALPVIPAALRTDAMDRYDEWHSGYQECRDQREFQHTPRAKLLEGEARDWLEDVSQLLFADRWALLATLYDAADGVGVVEACAALVLGDAWSVPWMAAARAYVRCDQ
jgi:hypothetical protein